MTAVSPVETFGLAEVHVAGHVTWSHADGRTRFMVESERQSRSAVRVAAPRVHNVRNALAAIAVGAYAGLEPRTLVEGLRSSGDQAAPRAGGRARGVTVLDDFAHHPTAVRETLAALRTGYPDRRIWAVFEPRSASSCRRVFQDDFAARLRRRRRGDRGRRVPIDASGERAAVGGAPRRRPEGGGAARRYVPDIDTTSWDTIVAEHRDRDVVVLMSNGGFGGIHRKLLQALGT
jgi:UDP-N-acetylmuramate: L-alanyl-gamma-D-glutamyl-meso-diaminopimelate ligase